MNLRLPATFLLMSALTAPACLAQEALEQARALYAELQDEKALAAANEHLLDEPGDLGAIELRARCLLNLGKPADALKTLSRLEDDEVPLRIKLLKSECMALAGQSEEALAYLDEILLEDAAAVAPRVKRSKVLISIGQYQRAFNELNLVFQVNPNQPEAILTMGMVHEGKRRFADAARMYQRLIQEAETIGVFDPHIQKEAVVGVARVMLTAGQYEKAIHWFGQLCTRFPDKAVYRFQLGISQGMRNKWEDAISNVSQAVEMEPKNLAFRVRLAELYYSQKRLDEAIAEFERIHAMSEDPRLASLRLAEMYLEQGDLAKAISHKEVMIRLMPESGDAQEVVGKIAEKTGDTNAAKEAYRSAHKLDPLNFQAMYRLALLLSRSEDATEKEEGRTLLARYDKIVPWIPDLDLVRAEINLSPGNRDLGVRLAAILNQAGEYDLAGVWLERTMRSGEPTAQMFAIAGLISANLGKTPDAKMFFQQALARLPSPDAKLQEYIAIIERGDPLPLPLGTITRPTETVPSDGSGGQ